MSDLPERRPPAAAIASAALLDDLAAALRAWRHAWWLPVISVLLGASLWANGAERVIVESSEEAAGDVGLFPLLLLVVSLLELGWFGTEREVYRRVWVGDEDPAADLTRVTLRYVGPFLRLGLLIAWPLFLAPFLVDADAAETAAVVIFVLSLAIQVALTFVTPELAYRTTRSASGAIVRGFGTLRTHFSWLRWHVLLPPGLVVTMGAAAGSARLPVAAQFVIGALGTLAGLALKGAIAHRWLILHATPVGVGGQVRG